jgi:hypothetical protein
MNSKFAFLPLIGVLAIENNNTDITVASLAIPEELDSSEAQRCVVCEETDATQNGCLCYNYDIKTQQAWFLPTNADGECIGGSKPVQTDYMDIYEWVATWNVEGTNIGAPYWWTWWAYYFYAAAGGVEVGEGRDEIINWSCLCIDPATGRVSPADTELKAGVHFNNYYNNVCKGPLRSIYNAQDYYEQFFGWCNYYINKKTCDMEEDIDKIQKQLGKALKPHKGKKGGKKHK